MVDAKEAVGVGEGEQGKQHPSLLPCRTLEPPPRVAIGTTCHTDRGRPAEGEYTLCMFITDVHVEGLADAPSLSLEALERTIRIAGPDPASTALGDGIALVFATLSEPHCAALLRHWQLLGPAEVPDILADPFPVQATPNM